MTSAEPPFQDQSSVFLPVLLTFSSTASGVTFPLTVTCTHGMGMCHAKLGQKVIKSSCTVHMLRGHISTGALSLRQVLHKLGAAS